MSQLNVEDSVWADRLQWQLTIFSATLLAAYTDSTLVGISCCSR